MKTMARQNQAKVATPARLAPPSVAAADRRATRQLPVIQAKLEVGAPNDVYEQEADRLADQVMRMPATDIAQPLTIQRKCAACEVAQPRQAGEEEEELLQAREVPGQTPQLTPTIEAQVNSLHGGGQPLDPVTRGFMESRFGYDFSRVRVHSGALAEQSARELRATAYTVGNNIAFGAGRYAPETQQGRHLLAHELAHTLQQQSPRSVIRRACAPPQPAFDLVTSPLGGEIQRALQTITVPAGQANQPPVPRVDPAQVLAILARSNCFLRDAQRAQERNPSLRIDAHELEEIGTHFLRGESRIELQVTNLAEVVKHIVHEVVHASHGALAVAAPTVSVGAVTRVEQAVIGEEMQTRSRENEIMQEIYTARALPRAALTPATAREVRRDFVSGLPHITYQEMSIVERMKSRFRSPWLVATSRNEGEAIEMARTLARDFMPEEVSVTNQARFVIDDDFVRGHRLSVASLIIPSLSLEEALTCVRVFRAYGRRINDDMRRRLTEISPSCALFIDRWHDYIRRNEPYDERARREFFIDILRQEEQRIHRPPEQSRYPGTWYGCRGTDVRQCFINLYDNVLSHNQEARLYFEWVLIAESLSHEWTRAGDGDAARRREIRLRHIAFLRGRIGGDLAGISVQ